MKRRGHNPLKEGEIVRNNECIGLRGGETLVAVSEAARRGGSTSTSGNWANRALPDGTCGNGFWAF